MASKTTPPQTEVPTFSPLDYAKFFGAGALAATLTHGAATPIDVVKTRIQVDDVLIDPWRSRSG